jgi:hypothetical protein
MAKVLAEEEVAPDLVLALNRLVEVEAEVVEGLQILVLDPIHPEVQIHQDEAAVAHLELELLLGLVLLLEEVGEADFRLLVDLQGQS